jgi:hypothetical protein
MFGFRDAILAVDSFNQVETGMGEEVAHDLTIVLGVFDDQDTLPHEASLITPLP